MITLGLIYEILRSEYNSKTLLVVAFPICLFCKIVINNENKGVCGHITLGRQIMQNGYCHVCLEASTQLCQ